MLSPFGSSHSLFGYIFLPLNIEKAFHTITLYVAGEARGERHCNLDRGTRFKLQWQSAFEVVSRYSGFATLAAGLPLKAR